MTEAEERVEQHKRRMGHMPWLYFSASPDVAEWAGPWQREIRERLARLENVELDPGCFVAPDARIFAEEQRRVIVGSASSIASGAFVHGPVELGKDVAVNHHASLEGGRKGIRVGDGTRIATGVTIYAFNPGTAAYLPVREQRERHVGIDIGKDVWIGANAGVIDGVTIADHAVVGMGAVVKKDVPAWAIVAGVPARIVGDRREGGTARR
jgi:acetyltransferase-like isoleucine patch superfamily enzyme